MDPSTHKLLPSRLGDSQHLRMKLELGRLEMVPWAALLLLAMAAGQEVTIIIIIIIIISLITSILSHFL